MTVDVQSRVTQTILHTDPKRVGNCFAACVATALGLKLTQVPHFVEWGIVYYGDAGPGVEGPHSHWHAMFLGFLAGRGLWPVKVQTLHDAPGELVFVGGQSPRGISHQVLYLDGELWHDPHPSRAGLASIDEDDFYVIREVGPGHHDHRPTPAEAAS